MEDLLITKETKYKKEPYFNALNSCVEFETLISLGGRLEGNQNEKRYIALTTFSNLNRRDRSDQVVRNCPPATLSAHLSLVRREAKTPAVLCHRRGLGIEGKTGAPSKPVEFNKQLTGCSISEGSDKESG
jgi:hypothetical protein